MEAVAINEITQNDLNWKIDYDDNRCTRCGKCIATCTFNALEMNVEQRAFTALDPDQKEHKHKRNFKAVPVVRQISDLNHKCVGCGMCEKVCPNEAIKPVRNKDTREAILNCPGGSPIKRGGRTNVSTERTLDIIKVGRISQMTDPSLDALRHTFDMKSPFGRVLGAEELPLKISDNELNIEGKTPPLNWIYPIIFGDMSIGALSTRAWEAIAIATAYLNEKHNIPIRMCSGEGGMPIKLLKSKYLKYMILQIASGHFGWNRIIKAMPEMVENPAGILIKIGQGAKPGDGGLLMAAKVAKHIQEIRGVPRSDLLSPPNHQGLYSIEESVQKMFLSFNAAFQFRVPVSIKVAASSSSVSVYNNLLRDPYHIVGGFFMDGIQGGTGAAHQVSLDHTGHPVVSKARDAYLAAVAQGKQGRIPLWAGGGMGMTYDLAADAFKMICLGANGIFTGKLLIQLLGCIGNDNGRCNQCNTGLCPTGICTQDYRLVQRLDVDKAAENIVNYMLGVDTSLKKLMAPIGNSSLPVGRSDALVSVDKSIADKLQIPFVC